MSAHARADRTAALDPAGQHAAATPAIQTKLAVGRAGDQYEQEADRVSAMVLDNPAPPIHSFARVPVISRIQRACAECEDELQRQETSPEEDPENLQGQSESGGDLLLGPSQEQGVRNLQSGGDPLSQNVRAFFEPRFGHDFGDVRVHTGPDAAESARSVGALAYTLGQDVVFGAGQYSPDTGGGRRLLAHELTHVVQQGGAGPVQRQAESDSDQPGAPDPAGASADASSVILPGPPPASDEASFRPSGAGAAGPQEAEVSRQEANSSATSDAPERAAAAESPYRTGMTPSQISGRLGEGEPLDSSVRRSMESHFGQPLSRVRVHRDESASGLCDKFSAQAFAFGDHIAFQRDSYQPQTVTGDRLLRHELTHVLGPPAEGASVFRAACTTNCPPGAAPAFVPATSPSFNCYAYAMNNPGNGFLQPGQLAGTAESTTALATVSNPASTPAQLAAVLPYFTPDGVKRNADADQTTLLSRDCTKCCATSARKIISVTTDAATLFSFDPVNSFFAPMVDATHRWDHHWYRKDADRAWSHKRGQRAAQRDDASGTTPICNPCNADRNHGSINYTTMLSSYCL